MNKLKSIYKGIIARFFVIVLALILIIGGLINPFKILITLYNSLDENLQDFIDYYND